MRLLGGCLAIVARHRNFNAIGDHGSAERGHPADHAIGHIRRVNARLLGNLHGHRRRLPVLAAMPDVAGRLIGAVLNLGHIAHEYGLALAGIAAHGDNQLTHIGRRFKVSTGLHQKFAIARHQCAGRLQRIADLERHRQILRRYAKGVHPFGVHYHADHVIGAANGRHIARPLDTLEFNLGRMRHLL